MPALTVEGSSAQRDSDGAQALRRSKLRQAKQPCPPRPEAILSEPGRPLSPGVRRDMEAQLGYDFAQVRIHNDDGAGAITALIGADAVAVGQEIFFADKAFRPETEHGRRLLAHELLHTVQVPSPPPDLRNAVMSRRLDAVEREAESVAQRDSAPAELTQGKVRPAGYLRFTSISAAQLRAEQLDPFTLIDRIVAGVIRSLRGDPADSSRRVRQQLERMAPPLREDVSAGLQMRLSTPDFAKVEELTDGADTPSGPAPDTAEVPTPVGDRTEDTESDTREEEAKKRGDDAHTDVARGDKPSEDADEAEDLAAEKDSDERERRAQDAKATPGKVAAQRGKDAEEEAKQQQEDAQERDEEKQADEQAQEEGTKDAPGSEGEEAPAEPSQAGGASAGLGAVAGGSGGPVSAGSAAAAGVTLPPGAGGALGTQDDRAEAVANDATGPLAKHGVKDEEQAGPDAEKEAPEQERPEGVEAGADTPVATTQLDDVEQQGEAVDRDAADSGRAPDPVPKTDPNLSSVPTAEDEFELPATGEPPRPREAPSLPPPPPVEAEPEQLAAADRAEPATEPSERAAEDAAADRALDAQVAAAADPTAQQPAERPEAPAPSESAEGEAARTESDSRTASLDDGPNRAEPEPSGNQPLPGDEGLAAPEPGTAASAMPMTETMPGAGGHPAQEGTLEPGGGGCAGAAVPTSESGGGEGAGGGGCSGGAPTAAEEKQPDEAPPDVSQQEPREALATIGTQPAAKIPDALGGVTASVDRSVGAEHVELQANPPTLERPVGAPATLKEPPQSGAPVQTNLLQLQEVTPDGLAKQRQAKPPPTPATGNPADRVRAPEVSGGAEEKVTEAEVQRMHAAVDSVPTTDERLYTTVGAAPKFRLAGETDPGLADEQKRQLDEQSGALQASGRADAAIPMGENKIYPNVPRETLRATIPARSGEGATAGAAAVANPGAGGAGAAGIVDGASLSAVAAQERGPQIQSALTGGQDQMGTATDQKEEDSATEREEKQAAIDEEIKKGEDEQAVARAEAKADIKGQRADWREQQDRLIADNDKEANGEHTKAIKGTAKAKKDTDEEAEKERDKNNSKIQDERRKAEDKARKERQRKKKKSSGWFSWVKSKIKAAFNALVNAVKAVFNAAIGLVNKIKDAFKAVINKLIDLATKAITGLIKGLANALIKISGVLLAAFPELRDKVRKSIENVRDTAVAKVQEYSDRLKKAVNKLIDALAGALIAILQAYEKLLLAAIEFVRDAVNKALSFVEGLIKMLGMIAALVKDIAPDPIGWIKNLGTAAKDGIKNFLWGETQRAVKAWFNEKVESVIGLGKVLWNVLVKGCLSVKQIGKMAWDAVIKSLPMMIISLVIEKLVSLIIPAAGAIVAIAQGLLAAYGAVSKIIAAFSAFFEFLRAVKSGGVSAACLFAKAVAAGAVALLDFIANFLLVRLGSALKGVGGRLKGIAQKIMAALGRGAKAVRKGAGAAVNLARRSLKRGAAAVKRGVVSGTQAVRRGATAGARAVRKGAKNVAGAARAGARRASAAVGRATAGVRRSASKAVASAGRTVKRLGKRLATTKVGKAVIDGARKVRDGYRKVKQKLRDRRRRAAERRRQRKGKKKTEETEEVRLKRIVERIKPHLAGLLGRGVGRLVFGAVLAAMRNWYRLSSLVATRARHFDVLARINPVKLAVNGVELDARLLLRYIRKLAEAILEVGRTAASPHVERGKYSTGDRSKRRLTPAEEGKVDARHRRELVEVNPGARAQDVHAVFSRERRENPGTRSIIRYRDPDKRYLHDTQLKQGGRWMTVKSTGKRKVVGNEPRNQLVLMGDPKSGRLRALKYSELIEKIRASTRARQQQIARGALDRISGRTPDKAIGGFSDDLSTWVIHAEPGRNPAAFVTSALALDAVASGKPGTRDDLVAMIKKLPMAPKGAQRDADELKAKLDDDASLSKRTERLAQAEIEVITTWVRTMHVLSDNERDAQELERQLRQRIRERLFFLFALTIAEQRAVNRKVGGL